MTPVAERRTEGGGSKEGRITLGTRYTVLPISTGETVKNEHVKERDYSSKKQEIKLS